MILKDGYSHQVHIIWVRWHFWIVTIHMEPADGWWVAWTWGHKNVAFGNSSEKALEKIKKKIREKESK